MKQLIISIMTTSKTRREILDLLGIAACSGNLTNAEFCEIYRLAISKIRGYQAV